MREVIISEYDKVLNEIVKQIASKYPITAIQVNHIIKDMALNTKLEFFFDAECFQREIEIGICEKL